MYTYGFGVVPVSEDDVLNSLAQGIQRFSWVIASANPPPPGGWSRILARGQPAMRGLPPVLGLHHVDKIGDIILVSLVEHKQKSQEPASPLIHSQLSDH
jgi:hypothetical protein